MSDRENLRTMVKRLRKSTLDLMGVRVDNIDIETALETVHAFASVGEEAPPRRVFFANVHTIHLARRMPEFRRCVNDAEMVLADGSGVKIAGRAFGTPIRENLNGTDLAPKVFRYAQERGCTVYLLGAKPEVAERCRERLRQQYPDLRIVGSHSGYFRGEEERRIIGEINAARPDILLVAFGSPIQEMWISRHREELRARVCFAVGGLFDFIAGVVRRAPRGLRAAGFEWLYRFIVDPKNKWKRVFLEIPPFLALVLYHRFAAGRRLALK